MRILVCFVVLFLMGCPRPKKPDYCVHAHVMAEHGHEVWILCGPKVKCTEEEDPSGKLTKCWLDLTEEQH